MKVSQTANMKELPFRISKVLGKKQTLKNLWGRGFRASEL